jgi:hypothetical protein
VILPDISGVRPKMFCRTCGGGWHSLGPESRYIDHLPGCPRNPVKPVEAPLAGTKAGEGSDLRPTGTTDARPSPAASTQSYAEQEHEREVLTAPLYEGDVDDWPRYPPVRWPEGPSALSDMVWRS